MKKLSSVTISGGLTVDQATTLSGVVSVGGIGTGAYTSVLVRNSSNQMLYRNYSDFLNDISGSLNLSGYVPTSRTLTINGTTYDLSANRTWTITTPFVSKLQHTVKAGVAINKGQAVYVTGADGTNMIVGLASNASEATSSKTMGLLDATVTTNGFANVVTEGLLAGLDTSGANAAGDPVWLGTGGNLIYGLAGKPYAPAHLVFIGIVTRKNANNGEIFVKVQNGFELDELHDVDLKTNLPTAGQLLRYNSDGLWKNWSPNYLTAESDTLATVTGRGATTNTSITVGPDLIVQADGSVNYTASRLWLNSHNNYRGAGVHMSGVGSTWFAGTPYTDFDGGYVIARTGTSNDVSSAQYSNALLTVKSSGNVGIGTSNPQYKVHVVGNGAFTGVSVNNSDTSGSFNRSSIDVSSNQITLGFTAWGQGSVRAGTAWVQTVNNWPLVLGVNDLEVMRLATSGNVGIGTTSPSYKLDVSGALRATGTLYSDNGSLAGALNLGQVVSIGSSFGSYANLIFTMHNGGGFSDVLKLQGNGNVGIGTTSPGAKLDIVGSGSGLALSFGTTVPNNPLFINTYGGWSGIGMDQTTAGIRIVGDFSSKLLDVGFYTGGVVSHANWVPKLVVLNTGNVGIGTTTPGANLDVAGGYIYVGPSDQIQIRGVDNGGIDYYAGDGTTFNIRTTAYNNPIVFSQVSGERMRITSTGNVGIGTSTPGNLLTVNGNMRLVTGTTQGLFAYDAASGGSFIFSLTRYTDNNANDLNINSLAGFAIKTNSGSAVTSGHSFYINTSGNVGIGTTSPGYKLEVNGNAWIENNLLFQNGGGGNAAIYGSAVDGVFRIKNNNIYVPRIEFLDSSSNVMLALNNSNVGIGTTNPGAKLHVVGNTYIQSGVLFVDTIAGYATNKVSLAASTNFFLPSGNIGIKALNTTASLSLGTSSYDNNPLAGLEYSQVTGGGRLDLKVQTWGTGSDYALTTGLTVLTPSFDTNNVRVGIGTTTPSYKLDVSGSGRFTGGVLSDTLNSVTYPYSLTLGTSGADAGSVTITAGSTAGYNTSIYVGGGSASVAPNNIVFNTASAERMRINSDGNVGMGTTNPKQRLIVEGVLATKPSGVDGYYSYLKSNWNENDAFELGISENGYSGTFHKLITSSNYYFGSTLQFWTADAERIRINASGNVGIGTTTPNQRLSVEGGSIQLNANNVAANYYLYLNKKSGQDGGILFNRDNASDWQLTNGAGNGDLIFYSYGTGTEAITFKRGTGNVGIGTTSPSQKLHITGNQYTSGDILLGSSGTYNKLRFYRYEGSAVGGMGWDSTDSTFYIGGIPDWGPTAGNTVRVYGFGQDLRLGNAIAGDVMTINTSANVGIGTISPSFKTTISADITKSGDINPGTAQLSLEGATTPGKRMILGYDTNSNGFGFIKAGNYGVTWTALSLQPDGGNVGIGTVSPSTKLDVVGVITATGGNSTNWNTAYGWGNHASAGYATTSYVTTQINNLIAGAPGALDTLDELAAALGDDASFATTVTNSIAGKVSKAGDIITTSNNYGLVIDHTPVLGDFVDALLVRSTTSGQRAQIGFATVDADGNHHRASIRAYKGPGTLEGVFGIALRQAGSGAHIQRLTLDYLGNLTIGGFLTESSSLKLKENVETSEGNLEKVVNLRPVTYNKIGSQTTELGLIAEEVAEVYPEFVQYDENGDPIGVNYSRLTAALIGAVKELTNQVQELNKKING